MKHPAAAAFFAVFAKKVGSHLGRVSAPGFAKKVGSHLGWVVSAAFRTLAAVLLALLPASSAAAFELFLNTGKEDGAPISVLHLKNHSPFSCRFEQTEDLKEFYRCEIEGKSKFISNQDLTLFSLRFINQANSLVIYIHPKVPSRLLDASLDLFKTQDVYVNRSPRSREFSIEFYPGGFAEKAPNGLDFVVTFKDLQLPYIGALDLDQNPVSISDTNDINIYLNLKKTYDSGDFTRLLDLANSAITSYPSSIFISEFYLYRLRALFGDLDSDTSNATAIIDGGKEFMRNFASSQNYSEVVRMMVRSHLKLSQRSDADYYIDMLNSEQPDDYFTRIANLDYADFLVTHQRGEMAVELYNNILFGAKEPELASRAAYALAKISLAENHTEQAREFAQKILGANDDFLIERRAKSIALADEFFRREAYDVAASIYELIIEHSFKHEQFFERILRDLAYAQAKLGNIAQAKKWLERYKKDFPVGEFSQSMDELNDELYFEMPGADSYALHEHYRMLMAKYENHIAARALKEEVKLLFAEREFEQIFALKEKIMQSNDDELKQLYAQALKDLLLGALHRYECNKSIYYIKELSMRDLLSTPHKGRLLSCLERQGDYALERELAEKFRPNDEVGYDIVLARLDSLQSEHKKVISRLVKTLQMRSKLSREESEQIYSLLATAALGANEYNDAMKWLQELEKYAAADMKLVAVYAKFLGYFKLHNLELSAINYGQKAIEIQNRLGVNLYSPQLEFITLEALLPRKKYEQMLEISHDLLKLRLSAAELTRAHYLRAFALIGLEDALGAVAELERCSEGQWLPLCVQLLQTLDEGAAAALAAKTQPAANEEAAPGAEGGEE